MASSSYAAAASGNYYCYYSSSSSSIIGGPNTIPMQHLQSSPGRRGGGATFIPIRYNIQSVTKHSYLSSYRRNSSSSSRSGHLVRSSSSSSGRQPQRVGIIRPAAADNMTTETETLGINILKNPPQEKLSQLGVKDWPKWGCPPSKFPWTYTSKETCYLLKGKVKVYPDGSDDAVEIGAGDLVVFPKGMSCTWDVSETVDKHYLFE